MLAFIFPIVCLGASPPLLDTLANELNALRALPLGSPAHAVCPRETQPLVGLSQEHLQNALGSPDYNTPSEWSYFFTSPVPERQYGGGFPQLTFIFNTNKKVVRISCYYAR